MAEEQFDPMAELEGEEEEEEEQEEEQEGGSPLMRYLPIIVGVLVVQVIIAYVLVNWVFAPDEAPEETAGEVVEEAAVAPPPEELAPQATGAQSQPLTVYEKIEIIVVNPAETEGLRFLSTQVHLGLRSPEVETMIDENKLVSKINDTLVGIFAGKTVSQLEPSKNEDLKEEIKEKLNRFLGPNAVLDIYFQSFVLQ